MFSWGWLYDFGLYDFTTAKTPLLRGAGGVFISFKLTVLSLQWFLAYKLKIKNQQSTPEGFALTGEAIVNQINAFVAKS